MMKSLIVASVLLIAGFAHADNADCRKLAIESQDGAVLTEAGRICIRTYNMKAEGQGQKGKILVSLFDKAGKIQTVIPMGYMEEEGGFGRHYLTIKRRSSAADSDSSNIVFKERLDTSELKKGEVMGSVSIGGTEFSIITEQDGSFSSEEASN